MVYTSKYMFFDTTHMIYILPDKDNGHSQLDEILSGKSLKGPSILIQFINQYNQKLESRISNQVNQKSNFQPKEGRVGE